MSETHLKELLSGNIKYFEEFYEETKKSVFYNIYAVVQDYQIAEDILQETYIKFLNNITKLRVSLNPLGYLFKISMNLSYDYAKNRKKEVNMTREQEHNICIEEKHDDSGILHRAKLLISEKEFEIVILHVINGYTHKEISKLINKPIGTVTWAYNNAIKKMQKGLKD